MSCLAQYVLPLIVLSFLLGTTYAETTDFTDIGPNGEPLLVTFNRQKELLCIEYPQCCPPSFNPLVFAYDFNGTIMNDGKPLANEEENSIMIADVTSYRLEQVPGKATNRSDRLVFWLPHIFLIEGMFLLCQDTFYI